jgi:hypothetical protein
MEALSGIRPSFGRLFLSAEFCPAGMVHEKSTALTAKTTRKNLIREETLDMIDSCSLF